MCAKNTLFVPNLICCMSILKLLCFLYF